MSLVRRSQLEYTWLEEGGSIPFPATNIITLGPIGACVILNSASVNGKSTFKIHLQYCHELFALCVTQCNILYTVPMPTDTNLLPMTMRRVIGENKDKKGE